MQAFREAMSPTLVALLGMSVVALSIGLERLAWALRFRRRLQRGRAALLGHLKAHSAGSAADLNAKLPQHPATGLFDLVLHTPANASLSEVRRLQMRVLRAARKRLWVLGSIGSIAPFVGLMGTVIGVMEAFRAMGTEGAGGFAVVSHGISEALVTTAAGIFVAVEAVVLFNYLQVSLAETAAELKDAVEEMAELRAGAGDGHLGA